MHVESLLHKNRGAVVDIEQCDTVKQFRSRQIVYEEDPESCSDDKFSKSQADFQTCTHSITTSVNDDMESLNSLKSITSRLCKAINSISSDCVKHLEKCLDAEDVVIMSENHIEQLKLYFIKLAGDKVDSDIDLDNCKESSEDLETVDKDIRNTLEENISDEVDKIENEYIQESQELENDYVMDERDSEEAVEEEPVKHVAHKSVDVSEKSSSTFCNLNFLLLIICVLSLHSKY